MMMQNNKRYTSLAVMVMFAACMYAQQDAPALGEYRYDDATQLWRLTDNAAGLGIDTTRNRGFAQIGYYHHSGDYTRVQEGTRSNQLRFETERYQKVGKYLYGYGKFEFDYGRVNNRTWCDVRRPYNSNPYFSGSAIVGKYDFQDFNFTAALGSAAIGKWHFGMKLDYNVGDLSRLRDPRPRSQTLDYKITPAVTFSFGKNTFGLSGNYHRRKEKISGVKNIQSDAAIMYYNMTGLEHATGTVSGYDGYQREWVDHRFGAELSYGFKNRNYSLVVAANIERGAENIYGQYKKEEGKYVDYKYGISILNRFRTDGNLLHEIDFKLGYEQSYADEYRQEYKTENNDEVQSKTYSYEKRNVDGTIEIKDSTITKTYPSTSQYYVTQMILKKRFQVKVFNTDFHYRLNFTDGNSVKAYVGTRFTSYDAKNKYILPESNMHYDGYNVSLEGGTEVVKKRLWIDGNITMHFNGTASLELNDPTTDYAQGVLIPDMEYYKANYVKMGLSLTYQFPVTIKKKRTMWYARCNGDWLRANNNMHAASFGVTLGMFN
jgi:hypothetical protein